MKLCILSFVLVAVVYVTSAAYVPGHPLVAREEDACENVETIVSLLEQRHATPFCSSFLSITPQTVTTTTKTKTKTTVETSFTTIPTTVTTIWTTFPLTTTTRFRVIGLSTTFLRTTTVPVTETTTVTTPGTDTLTVTTYYTPNPLKMKRATLAAGIQDLEARDGNIPGYLKPYPTPSISQACSCLSIPTPTITEGVIYTTTTTSTKTKTTTSTWTQSAYIRPVSTTTFFYTQIVPGVLTTYDTTTTATATTTTPPYATTTTVGVPLPTECVNIGSGGKLYDTLIQGPYLHEMIGYDIAATPGEELRSLCCNDCYNRPNCMYWRVVATTFCRLYSRIEPVADPETVTDQCPFGSGSETLQDPITDPLPDNPGFGKGPCL
ncbi:hypothetical protein V8F20_012364 [Naviculisporaceae sp. PSN 640]